MKGLPRAKDESRPRDAFAILYLEGIERLTNSLRRGDAFTAQALTEMQHLDNRLRAFSLALADRVKAAEEVLED